MQIHGGAGLIPGQPQVLRKDLDDLFCAFADRGFDPTRGFRVRPLALRPGQHLVGDVARENVAEGELSLISDAGARPAQDEFLPDERVNSLTRLLHREPGDRSHRRRPERAADDRRGLQNAPF